MRDWYASTGCRRNLLGTVSGDVDEIAKAAVAAQRPVVRLVAVAVDRHLGFKAVQPGRQRLAAQIQADRLVYRGDSAGCGDGIAGVVANGTSSDLSDEVDSARVGTVERGDL